MLFVYDLVGVGEKVCLFTHPHLSRTSVRGVDRRQFISWVVPLFSAKHRDKFRLNVITDMTQASRTDYDFSEKFRNKSYIQRTQPFLNVI